MARRAIASLVVSGMTFLALILVASHPTELAAANKTGKTGRKSFKRPIRNPRFDPSAEQVDLFEAVDAGRVVARLIPKDATGGNVLIENKTDQPLTVKIPAAVVGASIHAQLGNLPGGMLGAGNNQGPPGQAASFQMIGGAIGALQGAVNAQGPGNNQFPGNGQGPQNGMGVNFFSIPAEKVVTLTFNSVCLEHGKLEPDSSCHYTLVPVSKVSQDPVLYQLLAVVGSGNVNTHSAQAAAWHLTDKMSFQELADKSDAPLGGVLPSPYFSRDQIVGAKRLLEQATERAAELKTTETLPAKTPTQFR